MARFRRLAPTVFPQSYPQKLWEFFDGLLGERLSSRPVRLPGWVGRHNVEDRASKRRPDLGDLLSEKVPYAER